MKILGIDPGYDRLGIAIIEKSSVGRNIDTKNLNKERVLYSDCFQTSSKENIYERFRKIGSEVAGIINKFKPDALALETLFITKNQKTAMRVAEARGIIIYEAVQANVPVFEYSPMQIKASIASDGTADKMRMIKMVKLLVELPKKETEDDEYDAIAVALTHSAISK